jgi:hypothetical protein
VTNIRRHFEAQISYKKYLNYEFLFQGKHSATLLQQPNYLIELIPLYLQKIFKTILVSQQLCFYLSATCFGIDIDHHQAKNTQSLKGR